LILKKEYLIAGIFLGGISVLFLIEKNEKLKEGIKKIF
jgi:hypothetical protein